MVDAKVAPTEENKEAASVPKAVDTSGSGNIEGGDGASNRPKVSRKNKNYYLLMVLVADIQF